MKRFCLLLAALAAPLLSGAEAETPPLQRPPIYDRAADGEKQLADALARAKAGRKRVLAMFGANWCVWCHRLHGLMQSDPGLAAILAKDYETIQVWTWTSCRTAPSTTPR